MLRWRIGIQCNQKILANNVSKTRVNNQNQSWWKCAEQCFVCEGYEREKNQVCCYRSGESRKVGCLRRESLIVSLRKLWSRIVKLHQQGRLQQQQQQQKLEKQMKTTPRWVGLKLRQTNWLAEAVTWSPSSWVDDTKKYTNNNPKGRKYRAVRGASKRKKKHHNRITTKAENEAEWNCALIARACSRDRENNN